MKWFDPCIRLYQLKNTSIKISRYTLPVLSWIVHYYSVARVTSIPVAKKCKCVVLGHSTELARFSVVVWP
jgi:hypothetical protein